ncbi:MAG TPA: 16S rRNA methyltransferase [Rectinemataceae bacterium]|nr:16S rRNA methyltransferase [Rectinemataceae bacterium]
MGRTGKIRGAQAFNERYAALYGPRWADLREALLAPSDSVPFRAAAGCEPYFLDSASVFAAQSLLLPRAAEDTAAEDTAAEERSPLVLDACAAPGGKSLVLASRLAESGGDFRLVANELSADRRRRLAEVLDRHLPSDLRAKVEVSGRDAASLCRSRSEAFDAILLDAPCSSERHVLADPRALAEWSPGRSRNLAVRQWALLSSAFLMLKPGGCLVYSTCALAPEENQGLVARLEAKYGGLFDFDSPRGDRGEEAGPGLLILPDRSGGAGPIFVCRILKRR